MSVAIFFWERWEYSLEQLESYCAPCVFSETHLVLLLVIYVHFRSLSIWYTVYVGQELNEFQQCFHKGPQLRTWSSWGPNCWNGPHLVLISRKKSHFPNYERKVVVITRLSGGSDLRSLHWLVEGLDHLAAQPGRLEGHLRHLAVPPWLHQLPHPPPPLQP